MVQEYVSPVRVHKFPFEMVMAAYELRFPTCPQIPVVVDCTITEDSWSADDSIRRTTRRCQLNVEAPYLFKKMIGVDFIYFIQKNVLDLRNRVLEIEATNESFASKVGVLEKCRYYVHPEQSEWTCFEQRAYLDVKSFFGLENAAEKIAIKQYAANIAKGKELIEIFMKQIHSEGLRLLPWDPKDKKYNRELRRILSRNVEPLTPQIVVEAQKNSQPGTSTADGHDQKSAIQVADKHLKHIRDSFITIVKKSDHRTLESDRVAVEPARRRLNSIEEEKKLNAPRSKSTGASQTNREVTAKESCIKLETGSLVNKKVGQSLQSVQNAGMEAGTFTESEPLWATSVRELAVGRSVSRNFIIDRFRRRRRANDDNVSEVSATASMLSRAYPDYRPCYCPPTMRGHATENYISTWDALVLVVVGVAGVIMLTTPLIAYFLNTRRK